MKNLETLSDKELMNIGKKGDKDKVFSILYKRHSNTIKGFCFNKLKNPIIAEDIAQDTFMKIYKSWGTYKEHADSTVKNWLYKIAENNCIDYFRKKKNVNNFSELFSENCDVNLMEKILYKNKFEEPHKEVENKDLRFYLEKAMKKAFKKSKISLHKLIEMRYFEGLEYHEIAEKLERPIGTIQTSLFLARQLLREELNKSKSISYER